MDSSNPKEDVRVVHSENEDMKEWEERMGTQNGDKEYRRLLRKIDGRVVPILAILYLLSFLDRGKTHHPPDTFPLARLTLIKAASAMPTSKGFLRTSN